MTVFALFVTLLLWEDAVALQGILYTAAAILSAVAGADYFIARRKRILGR